MHAADDLRGAKLGDRRRVDRAVDIATGLASRPERSLPQVFGHGSRLDLAYRWLSNDGVEWGAVQEAHTSATWERAQTCSRVLAVYDTTDIVFPRRNGRLRENLVGLTTHTQGFYLHTSILVAHRQDEEVLGVVGLRPYVHLRDLPDDEATRTFWRAQNGLLENEADRWLEAIERVESAAPADVEIIHVGDRETDDYSLHAPLVARGIRFVFRNYRDRSVILAATGEKTTIAGALAHTDWEAQTRPVSISARSSDRSAKDLQTYPARGGRLATLSFRACTVQVLRPSNLSASTGLPPHLTLNVVEALERDPPAGETPVRWVLVTTEPIATITDILAVVDIYCARWNIEELFKCLKSGCLVEDAQLDSAAGLLRLLAVLMPVVTYLLHLRHMQRQHPNEPATTVLSPDELAVLQREYPRCFTQPAPTVSEAVNALARLGGHLKRNGLPGWLVLARGTNALFHMMRGWRLARERQDESNP